jgi:hypothetical protein
MEVKDSISAQTDSSSIIKPAESECWHDDDTRITSRRSYHHQVRKALGSAADFMPVESIKLLIYR